MARNYKFNHSIIASMHYNRAIICLNNGFSFPDGAYLFYASLELRICMERLLFEYLVIMKTESEKLDKFMSLYRIKDLGKAIYEIEPEFDKKIEYTNFYLKIITGVEFEIPIPNIDILNSLYGKLGNYLHNFKKPEDSVQNQEWWNDFIQLIEETREYLAVFFESPRVDFKMNESGLLLYQAFKDKSISQEELKKKILITLK